MLLFTSFVFYDTIVVSVTNMILLGVKKKALANCSI